MCLVKIVLLTEFCDGTRRKQSKALFIIDLFVSQAQLEIFYLFKINVLVTGQDGSNLKQLKVESLPCILNFSCLSKSVKHFLSKALIAFPHKNKGGVKKREHRLS